MSVLAGIFYFDGRPIEAHFVGATGNGLDEFGPDRAGTHVGPGLVMLHRALHVTPEDGLERQPLVAANGTTITFDGRLDNRDALLLQLWHDIRDDTTDVALALRVYERWGVEGFSRLVGDWSLVIYDPSQHAVVMASDYMGTRPLHYCLRPGSVSWSTTLEWLVNRHGLHDELDERFIVGHLSLAKSPFLTPYKGILATPPAHSLTFRGQTPPISSRFWHFQATDIRYREQHDYEEHLRTVFLAAVRCRLRTSAPAWAELSGGLDSSSIVCAADMLVREGLVPAPDLATVSYVTDGSPDSDERRFMATIDEQRGRQSNYLQLDDCDLQDERKSWITTKHPSGRRLTTYQLMARSRSRVLLTGDGGDSVMGNFLDYSHDVADLLARRHYLAAVQLARRRALAAKRTVFEILHDASLETRSGSRWIHDAPSRLIAQAGGRPPATDENIADLFVLKTAFAAQWRDEWIRHFTELSIYRDLSHRRLVGDLMRKASARSAQAPSEIPLVNISHPYLHRPLVEFMLGIPVAVSAPPGEPRALMKRAFRSFLPARIAARFSKGYASPYFVRSYRGIVKQWLGRPDDLRVTHLECVDVARLLRYLHSLEDTSGALRVSLFSRLFTLERWLVSRDRHLKRTPAYCYQEGR